MRRIRKIEKIAGLLAILASVLVPVVASATPSPNSAVIITRIYDDCPGSTVSVVNNYPADISITDQGLNCFGFANLHVWRFSEDGINPATFSNGDCFRFGADLVISGTGEGEAGLQIAPWWSQTDGRLNVRTTDGEIACFGGRLPFFSFTAVFGLHYVKGTPIHVEMVYSPNGLSQASPATIVYNLTYNATNYTSGALPFDEGNPAEDPPHGLWGILTPSQVGGVMQVLWQSGGPGTTLRAEWANITFDPCTVGVEPRGWGSIKGLYR